MSLALLLLLLSNDPLAVHAELTDVPFEVGATLELRIHYELADGWSVPANPLLPGGEPAAMLQLDAPPEVRVVGAKADDLQALLRNAFLDLPHERLVTTETSSVGFELREELRPGSALELNVLLYVTPEKGDDRRARLLRQRYRLPLRRGARAERIDPGAAAWGRHDVLALGDVAPPFELPTPFGDPLALEELQGEGLIVLTTYRSCL